MNSADKHASTGQLQRVSPIALLYFFGRAIATFLRQLSNFIPVLVILFATSPDMRWFMLTGLSIALPTALIGFTLLNWWCFRYAITDLRLEVRQGILRRKQLTLDFDRIQQADVREPWYFRPFKLAVLGVESAGSDSQEVELAGLSHAQAYAHKERMLQEANTSAQAQEGNDDASPQTRTLFRLPLWEVARYGLIHNPILLFIPILLYPLSQFERLDDVFESVVVPYIERAMDTVTQYPQTELLWLGITAAVVVLLLVIIGVSMLIAVVRFYNYQLDIHDGRYHAHMGLVNKTSRSFQSVRLQRVIINQGIVATALRRVSVRINQTGQGKSQQLDKVFFVPILTRSRCQQLSRELALETPVWQSVHWASMLLPWLTTTVLVTLVVALISQFSFTAVMHSLWISALVALVVQWLSWRKRGLYMGERWFATRRGMIGQQQRFIPNVKVQAISLTQGPWLRLWGMAKLQVYSAAGRDTVAWLPYAQLKTLQQDLLQRTALHQGRWM